MRPDLLGCWWLVKVIGAHGFLDVPTQGHPGVALVKMFSERHPAQKPPSVEKVQKVRTDTCI
jgi:hypothetical protein